jgi:heat-inducible transcriptional repressor
VESELGKLTAQLVETGLAQWGGDSPSPMSQSNEILGKNLLVRGHSHLLENLSAIEDLERIRLLFEDLDRKKEMISLLSQAEEGDGVKIFIGAETSLFSLSGSSVIISPYKDSDQQVVGVLGVIAPTRTNYARLIPMVDHTAQVVSKLLA